MFPWEDDGNSQCITVRGPSLCIFFFRLCLYDLPLTTSLHRISLPLSQHSPSIITAQILYTHTTTTQNRSSPTLCHRAEFCHVIVLTQSNLYVIFLLRILRHTHMHTQSRALLSRSETVASAILLRQTHPSKTWTHLLTNPNIIFLKKSGRHRRLNISMTYCGNWNRLLLLG